MDTAYSLHVLPLAKPADTFVLILLVINDAKK